MKASLKFCSIAEIKEGLVVSSGGDERSIEADGVRIEIVPVSRFLSVQKYQSFNNTEGEDNDKRVEGFYQI